MSSEPRTKPRVIFVIGGPGAGKGTQCENLTRSLNFTHLSVGDILREERKTDSDTGKLIHSLISRGNLVPSEIAVGLVKKRIEAFTLQGRTKFLIDGFPRNQENIDTWNSVFQDSVIVDSMLFLECSEEEMLRRLLKRAESSGRADDCEEVIKKRFGIFRNDSLPVVEHFKQTGILKTVNGMGTIEEVFARVLSALELRN